MPQKVIYAEQPEAWIAAVATEWAGVVDHEGIILPPRTLRIAFSLLHGNNIQVSGFTTPRQTLPARVTPCQAAKQLATWLARQIAASDQAEHIQLLQQQARAACATTQDTLHQTRGSGRYLGAPEEDSPHLRLHIGAVVANARLTVTLNQLTANQAMRLVPLLKEFKAEAEAFAANPPEWVIRQQELEEESQEGES